MSKEQNELLERILAASLARSVDFVKFAEAKNAALLTFCSAWSLAMVALLLKGEPKPLPFDLGVTLHIALILLVIAAVITISSFLPRINLSAFNRAHERKLNLLFFGDIAKLSLEEFHSRVKTRYLPPGEAPFSSEYLSDLCEQITVNSKIASRKFTQFKWAAILALVAIAQFLLFPLGHRLIAGLH